MLLLLFTYVLGDTKQDSRVSCKKKKSNFGQLVVSMTNAVIGKETKVTVQVIHTFHNEPRSFFKQIFVKHHSAIV